VVIEIPQARKYRTIEVCPRLLGAGYDLRVEATGEGVDGKRAVSPKSAAAKTVRTDMCTIDSE
jgi:hypothetical protein